MQPEQSLDTHTPRPYRLRLMRADEAAYHSRYHRNILPQSTEVDIAAYTAWAASAVNRGQFLVVFAEDEDGNIFGSAAATMLEYGPTAGRDCPVFARICNCGIEPDWRNRGIGTKMIEHLIQLCRDRGVERFSLMTMPDAQPLYERLGFKTVEREMLLDYPSNRR